MARQQRRLHLPVLQPDADAQRGAQRRTPAAADPPRKGTAQAELSGGQQQRVAIARALVSDPKLLLCDEPTGDLDRQTADEILEMLTLLNRDYGKTIIMVTHDPEAAKYAKRTVHLDKGEFVAKELAA